jgi:hypothetical protein
MSYDPTAAEVAEDYRRALEDLTTNVRYEISNLTMIARENTEHALAIADVLQDHIIKVGVTYSQLRLLMISCSLGCYHSASSFSPRFFV